MGENSITDWLQAGAGVAALLLSLSHIAWQVWARRKAQRDRLSIEAKRVNDGLWRLRISYAETDRSQRLKAVVQILQPSHARLINAEHVKPERDAFNSPREDVFTISDATARVRSDVRLEHQNSSAFVGFVYVVSGEDLLTSANVMVTVLETVRRRSRARSTKLINWIT